MTADRLHGRPAGVLPQTGFSLIELMVVVSVLAVLLGLALPSFSEWIRNNQVRSAAESLRDGLQLARSEAVKRNARVRFQLVSTLDAGCAINATGPYWIVNAGASVSPAGACNAAPGTTTAPAVVQASPATASSARVTLAVRGASAVNAVTAFDAAGRQVGTSNPITTAGSPAFFVDVSSAAGACLPTGKVRCLRVTVSTAGQVRMCDPTVTGTDPARC
jgi:type IV fimbrial biogenesis protein FimT